MEIIYILFDCKYEKFKNKRYFKKFNYKIKIKSQFLKLLMIIKKNKNNKWLNKWINKNKINQKNILKNIIL